MTRGKKLLGLLAVMVLLVGTTVCVRVLTAEDEAVAEDVSVMTVNVDEVTSFGWRYGETEYLFLREENGWVYPADEYFPVSATTMATLLEELNGMTVEKTMTDVTDLSEYGLDNPACVIEVAGDGNYTVSIGGESAMGSNRYVTLDGRTVYMTDDDVLSNFTVGLYSMLRQESIPAMNHITAVTVERKGDDLVLRSEIDGDGNTVWYGADGEMLDEELVDGFLDDITTLYWSNTVEHHADEKALKAYGLTKPAAVLTMEYTETTQTPTELTDSDGNTIMDTVTEEKTFVLEIGGESEDGAYVRLGGSVMVYEIAESYAYEMLNITTENLLPTEE